MENKQNEADARVFLDALFSGITSGWVTAVGLRPKTEAEKQEDRKREAEQKARGEEIKKSNDKAAEMAWFNLSSSSWKEDVLRAAWSFDARGVDAYISTCPGRAKKEPWQRIKQEDATCIPVYFLDTDAGKKGCPSSVEEAQAALEALQCPPSLMVCSGHGLHAYWLLSEPARPEHAKELRRFAKAVKKATGYSGLDAGATEPARIMRIPGTRNHKQPEAPPPVFLLPSSGERYDVRVLDEWARSVIPEVTQKTAVDGKPQKPSASASIPADRVYDLAVRGKNGERFVRLWRGDASEYGGDHSEADIALCGILAFYTGRDARKMDDLFRGSGLYRPKWDEKHGAHTYGEMTIEKAIQNCRDVYRPRTAPRASESIASGDPLTEYEQAYEAVPPYYISERGETCYTKKDKDAEIGVRLCSFACLIEEERAVDNGQDKPELQFRIKGRAHGQALPAVDVNAREFSAMSWPLENWGTRANIAYGQSVKDRLRSVIVDASMRTVRRVSVYTFTGFSKIAGKWAYLYNGGAINAENVEVKLEGLEAFSLCGVPGISEADAIRASLSMREAMKDRVALPLLAYAYLAPLCSFLMKAGCAPSLAMFLKGRTQTRKTTAAVLCQQHFGAAFNARNLPASFEDTLNSIRDKAFAAKDTVLLVDDAHPGASQKERDKLADTINALASAWGERKGRNRCGADGRNTQTKPPRGLGLLTGEDIPATNESALSRFFVIEVKEGDVPKGEALTNCQGKAEAGYLQQAMRGYVAFLAEQGDDLPKLLSDLFHSYREDAMQHGGLRDRLYEAVAHLRIGIEMFARYAVHAGALNDAEADKLREAARLCFYEAASAQTADIAEENPTKLFMEAVRELLENRTCILRKCTASSGAEAGYIAYASVQSSIGYADDTTAYLNPGETFAAVSKHFREQGMIFPLAKSTLYKRLADEGICESDPSKKGSEYYNLMKRISGRTIRGIRVSRALLPNFDDQPSMEAD